MEAVEAVKAAKEYILDVFEGEEVVELGLEELEFVDERPGVWEVTLGFRRRWHRSPPPPPFSPSPKGERTYKKVRIRDDGKVISLRHRDVTVPA